MNVLIIGASSYVGASVYSKLKNKYSVTGTYNAHKLFPELEYLDITDHKKVEEFITSKKPGIIIHIAAIASRSACEKNPKEAIAINETGTKAIVDSANKVGAKIIFISSLILPNSVYATTKINAEKFVKQTKAGYIIIKPSHIVGFSPNTTNDREFNRFLKNITEKTPAIYDISWKLQPTYLRQISEVVNAVIEKNISNEVIDIAIPEIKNRFNIAKDLLTRFGVVVQAEDKKDQTPFFPANLTKLKELNLPQYDYDKMIKSMTQEIKDYLKTK